MVADEGLRAPAARAERLYPRCLFCGGAFPASALFGRVPPGDRLVYDPLRSRLWSTCQRCGRWNLAPLEERPDAIEELERVVRDAGVLLAATENVALYHYEDLSVVRIGPAPPAERATWRYGRELRARAAAWRRPGTRLTVLAFGAIAHLGEAAGAWKLDRGWGPSAAADALRWGRFGREAWAGRSRCRHCGSVLLSLRFDISWWLYPRVEDGRLVVGVPCTRCDPWTPRNVFDVSGAEAELVLRRVLAYQHVAGACESRVREATSLIEGSGSSARLLRELADGRNSLWRLGPLRSLALDMALNDLAERRQLVLWLKGIEAEWRDEDELATIVDGELSWPG